MKPKKTLTIPEYNEKLKSLSDDDEPLDDYWDHESENAKDLAREERKRVAQALLAAAASLDGGASFSLEDGIGDLMRLAKHAKQYADRKDFAKTQAIVEAIRELAASMVDMDMFRDADLAARGDAETEADRPSWAR